jgi:hypothetical protein
MVKIYCRERHRQRDGLCAECRSLLDYAEGRLEQCVFQEKKPTCARCPVHCYQAACREQVKVVMRFAGPRMPWRHPILAIRHIFDSYRPVPSLKSTKAGS